MPVETHARSNNRRPSMSLLAEKHCRPLPAGTAPLGRAQLDSLLKEVPGWAHIGQVIAKSWSFENYYQTMAFVNAVAWIAHREDHHPDMSVGYNRCRVEFSTHSIGGISENDFICAAKIEALGAG
jgi:4a-hydroxytetrahydrobiopterin dehydratase